MESSQLELNSKLLNSCYDGDSELVQELLDFGATVFCSDETGRTPLHFAAASGDVKTIECVLNAGIPWNSIDDGKYSAGDYALQTANSKEAYDYLVEFGYKTELVLKNLGKSNVPITTVDTSTEEFKNIKESNKESQDLGKETSINKELASNIDYLNSPITYIGDRLLDAQNNGVMMEWEEPIMYQHALAMCKRNDEFPTSTSEPKLKVLNVGFGMGIIDSILQTFNPKLHVIVEAHKDVYNFMISQGWDKKPNVIILFGRWQDKLPELQEIGKFDAIFFDTFGEFYQDLHQFHTSIFGIKDKILLEPSGIYSFFNGLGGHNLLFHDVYCKVVNYDLNLLGVDTKFVPVVVDDDSISEEAWKGINRPYWMLQQYNLPICTLKKQS
ncbi:Protein arginine N-methyltransferase 2 [Smittium culicis]|uniref:Arginine N-methyltransferase 2 n=1 Tax=Smittium culicis TaxID=133412 RepID=A0A1R1X1T7_9FUNG|nr:Protein arginine N-methyltransferase 2 [Smittium culicis]